LKEAARFPKLFAEYIDKWVPDRPSDAHCISELELDRGFSADAARSFLRIFDETVAFAKLDEHEDEFSSLLNDTPTQEEAAEEPAPEARKSQQPDIFSGLFPTPAGPKPLQERLQVATNGNRLSVTASLVSQDEVDTLIRILEANKLVLPAPPPPSPNWPPKTAGQSGAGAVDLD